MSNQLLDEIDRVQTILEPEQIQNIDPKDRVADIVYELDKMKDTLLNVEKEWSKIDHENSYSIYYGVRSVILVLEKIIERFETESVDNVLQITKDTQKVLPFIKDIIQDAEHYKTNDDLAKHILEKTDQLDEIAYDANLLKSDEEYLEDVDKKSVLKLFDGISSYRYKGETVNGDQVVIKILPSSNQQPKINQKELNMIHEFYSLQQLIKEHERKWLSVQNPDSFYFGVTVNVVGLVMDNARFNIENFHFSIKHACNVIKLVVLPKQENQSLQKPEPFIQVFPKLSKLIKNILDITKDTSITEERKDQMANNKMDLISYARKIDLVDFNKYGPPADPDVAKRQYDEIMKRLETIT